MILFANSAGCADVDCEPPNDLFLRSYMTGV